MKCCNQEMRQERAKQYLETRHECGICRKMVAIHDDGEMELLREERL